MAFLKLFTLFKSIDIITKYIVVKIIIKDNNTILNVFYKILQPRLLVIPIYIISPKIKIDRNP